MYSLRDENAVKRFKLKPELTGIAINNLLKLPASLHKSNWYGLDGIDIEKLLYHVRLLEEFSVQWIPNVNSCLETFWWLKQKLAKSERLINLLEAEDNDDDGSEVQSPSKWAKMFSLFGGVKNEEIAIQLANRDDVIHCLFGLLQYITTCIAACKIFSFKNAFTIYTYIFFFILKNEEIAIQLANRDDVIHCLFGLLQYITTCIAACKVIESLLLSRKNPLDLSTIKEISELISGFENVQLANFCKILAITLSDLDMYEHKSSLFAQMKQKKNHNFYVRDINQDVIINIPNIMKRMTEIACAKPYIPCFPRVVSETDQWVQWIDNQVKNEILNTQEFPFICGISQWSDTNGLMRPESAIQIATEFSFRANAVCVLGLLLVGRHRRKVQKELAELGLIPQLSELFDHFVWRWNIDHNRFSGHNTSCECSPEVALKIQVLRLIHSFCDHSEYKHTMLSWSEYSELRELEGASKISCVTNVHWNELNSKYKAPIFWLSRAIESYLRGSTTSADQNFLIRRGLLEHVVGNLIASNIKQREVLQSSFDLLGELVKFNHQAFHHLDKVLNSEARQKKLLSLMSGSLVDSNMFIRSLILSQEHFLTLGDEDTKNYALKQCFLLSHVKDLRQRVKYLQKLISLITVENLTQENVSCLNTALVILIFAHKSGEMKQYLEILNKDIDDEDCPIAVHRPNHVQNLHDLLVFWQEHYLQEDKDCTVLEKSSRISFQEWQHIVELLILSDSSNPNSLLYHISPTSLGINEIFKQFSLEFLPLKMKKKKKSIYKCNCILMFKF
ncbi:short transient receptor potential channel 4-associated protein-like [Centruroides sculpturatus]|uniref:short transient receptor potential channel 4-associated protein-like n=1 Tax=Centruroides sculpturatus TaxID=218467 RepID=UPI000C6EB247|nr:short transient receptor potential channel 4-associated protein-like [Centruroides sculpturatus]